MIKLNSRKDLDILFDGISSAIEPFLVTFVNPFSYKYFRSGLNNNFDFIFSDGLLLTALNNFFYRTSIERASFDYSSIADPFFEFCSENKYRVAVIAATKDEVTSACSKIKKRHPNLMLGFFHDGYISCQSEVDAIVHQLSCNHIDIVIIGMGSPIQDEFSILLKKLLPSLKCIITCGGFITQTSIKDDYYFPIVKKLGLRWLQRFIMHGHVRRRVLRDYPIFLFFYLYDFIKTL